MNGHDPAGSTRNIPSLVSDIETFRASETRTMQNAEGIFGTTQGSFSSLAVLAWKRLHVLPPFEEYSILTWVMLDEAVQVIVCVVPTTKRSEPLGEVTLI
jgi:hypothetical protein